MYESRSQAYASPTPTESMSTVGGPPASAATTSLPSAKNPTCAPSGEKNGATAPSVPGIGVKPSSLRRRTSSAPFGPPVSNHRAIGRDRKVAVPISCRGNRIQRDPIANNDRPFVRAHPSQSTTPAMAIARTLTPLSKRRSPFDDARARTAVRAGAVRESSAAPNSAAVQKRSAGNIFECVHRAWATSGGIANAAP